MPRIYRPAGPTADKSTGPAETKNKAPAQDGKTAKNTGKKDNGSGNK